MNECEATTWQDVGLLFVMVIPLIAYLYFYFGPLNNDK